MRPSPVSAPTRPSALAIGLVLLCGGGSLAAAGAATAPLAGTSWQLHSLTSMDDAEGVTRPSDPSAITMELREDGRISMRLVCNRGAGQWSAEPSATGASGRFRLGPLATTRALCPPPHLGETVARQMGLVRGYLLRDGLLNLSLQADGGLITWQPERPAQAPATVPASPGNGGPRRWSIRPGTGELTLRETPSDQAGTLAHLPPDAVLSNLGCRPAAGAPWCDVQSYLGGRRGWVPAAFLQPAVGPDGAVAIGPDDSSLRAGRGAFDARGRVPCSEAPEGPLASCTVGVARAGGGDATVVVTRPGNRTRTLFFAMGRPISADVSEADGPRPFSAVREGDTHRIQVGPERYEIPEALVLGG
jgi:heat shock protein HslJ